jgi:hypothetical protein
MVLPASPTVVDSDYCEKKRQSTVKSVRSGFTPGGPFTHHVTQRPRVQNCLAITGARSHP